MPNVRDYLRRKAERNEKKNQDFGAMIHRHRLARLTRVLLIAVICAGLAGLVFLQMENQVYGSYAILSSVEKQQYDSSICVGFCEGFLTYSKDGISYTDSKGNAMWNQTYEMQDPQVRIAGTKVAAADLNGHIVFNMDEKGNSVEIDTNLPIRELAVSESGIVAVVLEDTNTTWIYLYNSLGEEVAYLRTTMQNSGYPLALDLSPDGKLLAVSFLSVESGSMKSSVAFYNFSSVGQNYVDNFASGADYVDAVIPYVAFMDNSTSFAVADNRLVIYGGDQRPKSTADIFLNDQVQSVFYNESYIGLVFMNTTGEGRYRLDIYDTAGQVISSLSFDTDYKDIIIWKENVIIYNETQCILTTVHGKERFRGEFEKQYLLFAPVSGRRYLAVSKESIDIIEMK